MYEISLDFVGHVLEEMCLMLMESGVNLAPQIKCLIFKKLRVKLAPLAKKFHQVEKSVLTYHSITWDTNRYEMTLAPR
jgi:hypothetical protein